MALGGENVISSPSLKTAIALEVDSERRLSGPISSVLRRLRSTQLPEQRVVDRGYRWRKVGVVQNVRERRLEPRMHFLRDSEPLCHTKTHRRRPRSLNDSNSCIPEATCPRRGRQEGQVVVS